MDLMSYTIHRGLQAAEVSAAAGALPRPHPGVFSTSGQEWPCRNVGQGCLNPAVPRKARIHRKVFSENLLTEFQKLVK